MKRSEKIEIRVSLEEKERLAELARVEGESVSGLIRGLVEKYVTLNSPSTKRRLPKWQMAGLIGLAVLLGHGLTLLPMHMHARGHSAQTPTGYAVQGTINDSAFGFTIYPSEETTKTINLLGSGSGTKFSVHIDSSNNELDFSFWQDSKNQSVPLAKTSVEIMPGFPSHWNTKGPEGQIIFVTAHRLADMS